TISKAEEDSGDGSESGMSVEAALEAMRFKGKPCIHYTQLRATAKLISDGKTVAEVADQVLAATRKAVEGDDGAKNWDWSDEECALVRMCHDWITKRMKEDGEDLSHCLPDDMYSKWQEILKKGERPGIKYNGAGPYIRGFTWGAKEETQENHSPSEEEAPETKEEPPKKPRRIRLLPYDAPDTTKIPRRDWAYGSHYMRRIVSATIGPGGIGKSSLGLVEAVGMAIGRDLLGVEELKRPLRVWYHNGEDPREEINRRSAAICIKFGLDE